MVSLAEVDGYLRYEGNCPRNLLRRCQRSYCPNVNQCARLCSRNMLCEGISFIFDTKRPHPCLLKHKSCPSVRAKQSHNVRFYKKKGSLRDYLFPLFAIDALHCSPWHRHAGGLGLGVELFFGFWLAAFIAFRYTDII